MDAIDLELSAETKMVAINLLKHELMKGIFLEQFHQIINVINVSFMYTVRIIYWGGG